MTFKKLIKLTEKNNNYQAIVPFFINNKYYLKFYFNNNTEFLQVNVEKLFNALSSKRFESIIGLGKHSSKYLFVQIFNEKIIFFISETKDLDKKHYLEYKIELITLEYLTNFLEYLVQIQLINKNQSIFDKNILQ